MTNPYPTQPGFGLRLHHAKTALEKYGRDYGHKPYSRSFDNCFENYDGDAVVWALMYEAVANPTGDLAEGIRRTGKDVWSHWLEVYEQRGTYAPSHEQLDMFAQRDTAQPKLGSKTLSPLVK